MKKPLHRHPHRRYRRRRLPLRPTSGTAARDNIYGSCDDLGSNLGNCAIAAASFVLPFVSYGMLGLGKRLGRRTARAPDLPCGAGLCPCFVAGTLVATLAMSSVAGADAYVEANMSIETLQVGPRVLTALSDKHDIRQSEVTPDWQVIDLELGDLETDSQVLLTVLRPPEWLPHVDPDGDGAFELELPELRLRGLAHVIHVRGPPVVSDAPARVVLATVEHRVDSVLALFFEGDADEVVTTPNHPFYSVSRGWTTAGELQLGEAVETRDGERLLASAEYRDAAQSVFNLEVEGDHEYLVGESGLRVHNVCGDDSAKLAKYWSRHAPTSSTPYSTYRRYNADGTVRQVTTYDGVGRRRTQFDLSDGRRDAHRHDFGDYGPGSPNGVRNADHASIDEVPFD